MDRLQTFCWSWRSKTKRKRTNEIVIENSTSDFVDFIVSRFQVTHFLYFHVEATNYPFGLPRRRVGEEDRGLLRTSVGPQGSSSDFSGVLPYLVGGPYRRKLKFKGTVNEVRYGKFVLSGLLLREETTSYTRLRPHFRNSISSFFIFWTHVRTEIEEERLPGTWRNDFL